MKPYLHGLISVKKFGGKVEDYQKYHDWLDQTKAFVPDMRHRAILHNAFGIYLLEQVFGPTLTNSDGKVVSVRDVGEQHVLDDLGTIPTLQDYLTHLPWLDWLGGSKRPKGVKADEVPPAPETPSQPPTEKIKEVEWLRDLAELQRRQQELQKQHKEYDNRWNRTRKPYWPEMTLVD